MSRPRIVVVGNACRDVIYHLDRLPRPGETLIARDVVTDLGGKGLNQAIAAARAGAEVGLIAAIGDDATGAEIKVLLDAEGLDGRGLIIGQGISDDSLLLIDAEGENFIMSSTKRARGLTPSDMAAAARPLLAKAGLLLLQGNLGEATTFRAMELARAAGIR